MTPRPLYKWKSFWLGILVLVFFGWAWVRSIQRISVVTWTAANEIRQVQLAQWDSALHLWRGDNGLAREPGFSFETRLFAAHERAAWFPSAFTWKRDRDGTGFNVAHWFLILLFLVPWCAWLFYYWKREQKKPNA
jgi:hypothetical protein